MTQPVVVIGGGGMGRCVLDIIDAINAEQGPWGEEPFEVVGVLDDGLPDLDLLAARGVKFLGPIAVLEGLPYDVDYVLGIGSPTVKRTLDRALLATGRLSPPLVHPNVHMGYDVQLAPGCVVASHVSMENNIRLGRHVHVNQNSTVGHDCRISDYMTVSPLVAVSGNVTAGEAAFVGTGASIRQGVTLGAESVVGMGAAVVSDVGALTTVVGVPARVRR